MAWSSSRSSIVTARVRPPKLLQAAGHRMRQQPQGAAPPAARRLAARMSLRP